MYMRITNTPNISTIYNNDRINTIKRISRKQESKDTTEISLKAKLYSDVKKAVAEIPEVRMDKVLEYKKKLEEGYDVPNDKLADKFLTSYNPFDETL